MLVAILRPKGIWGFFPNTLTTADYREVVTTFANHGMVLEFEPYKPFPGEVNMCEDYFRMIPRYIDPTHRQSKLVVNKMTIERLGVGVLAEAGWRHSGRVRDLLALSEADKWLPFADIVCFEITEHA